jgi:hypothetical protein
MAFVKGRGVKVEVALTMATAKTVSAVTLANPAVATSTSHGLANEAVGVFSSVVGMVQLEGQACRVKNTAANTFELQGLNTTSYSAFTSGSFTPVATWATMAESDQYEISGGGADQLDVTCLIDVVRQQENGFLNAQTLNLNIKAVDTPSQAMNACIAAAMAGNRVVVRITLPNGAVRIAHIEPTLPSESVQSGAVGSGSVSGTVKGLALMLAA